MSWLTLGTALGVVAGVQAENSGHSWQYGASASYSRGDYGGEQTTEFVYLPFSVKRYLPWGDISLTLPYLWLTGDEPVVIVDGRPVSGSGAGSSTASGIGDVTARLRYYAVEHSDLWPYVDLVAKVKLPTADADEGLGTGKTDATLLVEMTRWLGARTYGSAELGYTFAGDPDGIDYKNRLVYSIGGGYRIDARRQVSAWLDGRTALVEGNDDPLSLMFLGQYAPRRDLLVDAMLELGMSDGAADLGLTLGLRWRY